MFYKKKYYFKQITYYSKFDMHNSKSLFIICLEQRLRPKGTDSSEDMHAALYRLLSIGCLNRHFHMCCQCTFRYVRSPRSYILVSHSFNQLMKCNVRLSLPATHGEYKLAIREADWSGCLN